MNKLTTTMAAAALLMSSAVSAQTGFAAFDVKNQLQNVYSSFGSSFSHSSAEQAFVNVLHQVDNRRTVTGDVTEVYIDSNGHLQSRVVQGEVWAGFSDREIANTAYDFAAAVENDLFGVGSGGYSISTDDINFRGDDYRDGLVTVALDNIIDETVAANMELAQGADLDDVRTRYSAAFDNEATRYNNAVEAVDSTRDAYYDLDSNNGQYTGWDLKLSEGLGLHDTWIDNDDEDVLNERGRNTGVDWFANVNIAAESFNDTVSSTYYAFIRHTRVQDANLVCGGAVDELSDQCAP